jgi:hypothetical protein
LGGFFKLKVAGMHNHGSMANTAPACGVKGTLLRLKTQHYWGIIVVPRGDLNPHVVTHGGF